MLYEVITSNKFNRHRLTDEEIQREVGIITALGHKRIALEAGEDDVNCPIEYILHAIETVYAVITSYSIHYTKLYEANV